MVYIARFRAWLQLLPGTEQPGEIVETTGHWPYHPDPERFQLSSWPMPFKTKDWLTHALLWSLTGFSASPCRFRVNMRIQTGPGTEALQEFPGFIREGHVLSATLNGVGMLIKEILPQQNPQAIKSFCIIFFLSPHPSFWKILVCFLIL